MPVFSWPPDDPQALDLVLLRNGPVGRYHDPAVLTRHLTRLSELGYRIHEFDCASWDHEKAMHADLARELRFPSYYGHNLDALHDCLSGLDFDSTSGIVLTFRNFNSVASIERHPDPIRPLPVALLDILSDAARSHLLFGHRLITLVQQVPEWRPMRFGMTDARVNDEEYFLAYRIATDAREEGKP